METNINCYNFKKRIVSMKDKKDMKDNKLKSNALHFLSYDMNLDWLHCIVPNA